MMFHSLLATLLVSVQASKDEKCASDEAAMLQDDATGALQHLRRTALKDDQQDGDSEALFSHNYCANIFHHAAEDSQEHHDLVDLSRDVCEACVLSAKELPEFSGPAPSYRKSPAFAKTVASCLAQAKADGQTVELPSKMGQRYEACSAKFTPTKCRNAIAHCTAVHATEALDNCADSSPAGSFDCVANSNGYLACLTHHLGHSVCLKSAMGAGNCLAKIRECSDAPATAPDPANMPAFINCFAQKRNAYFQANPAQASATSLCQTYYGDAYEVDQDGIATPGVSQVALDKCADCAAFVLAEHGQNCLGPACHTCEGEHCLRIPGLVQDMTQCMLQPALGDDSTSLEYVPTPFKGAVSTCKAVFPGDYQGCLQSGAYCLGLHPCGSGAECLHDDAWFSCFAKKMEFTACEKHPMGMATCLKCGVGLVTAGVCANGQACVDAWVAGNQTVRGAHGQCVQGLGPIAAALAR